MSSLKTPSFFTVYYLSSPDKLSSTRFTWSVQDSGGKWTPKRLRAYIFYHYKIPVECIKVLKVDESNVQILTDDHNLKPEQIHHYAVYVSRAEYKLGATTQEEFEKWWRTVTTAPPQGGDNVGSLNRERLGAMPRTASNPGVGIGRSNKASLSNKKAGAVEQLDTQGANTYQTNGTGAKLLCMLCNEAPVNFECLTCPDITHCCMDCCKHIHNDHSGHDITIYKNTAMPEVSNVTAGWACEVCTLINLPLRQTCDTCLQGARPDDYQPPVGYIPTDEECQIQQQDAIPDQIGNQQQLAPGNNQRQQPSEPIPVQVIGAGWACDVCTLVNLPLREVCDTCLQGERPADYRVPEGYVPTQEEIVLLERRHN